MMPLRLTSTGREGNTDQPAITLAKVASKSNAVCSQPLRLPRGWASKATIASGNTCCAWAIDDRLNQNALHGISSANVDPFQKNSLALLEGPDACRFVLTPS